MHNYFTDQIISFDILLALSIVILSVTIIAYALLCEHLARRRNKRLINIKKSVYEMALSGTKLSANTCAPFTEGATPQQFLDIETNRNSVFFNKNEQEIFRACFTDPGKIAKIEKAARSARNKWRRIEATLILSYLDDGNAPSIFEKALLSGDDDIRYFSMLALGQMKNQRSAGILVNLIKDDNFSRRKIVSILEGFPPDITSECAMPLLNNDKADVRFWTLKLLSRLKPGKHLPEISRLSVDASERVRSAACECLGNSGISGASEILSRSLKDNSWLVRSAAVKAISELLGDDCVPEIIGLLGDNSLSVLSAVREALVIHIRAAMPYIEKIYAGGDRMAKIVCVEAVEEAMKGKPK